MKLLDTIRNGQEGLTKFELISAMCLQGLLSRTFTAYPDEIKRLVSHSIKSSKELLKQLESEGNI